LDVENTETEAFLTRISSSSSTSSSTSSASSTSLPEPLSQNQPRYKRNRPPRLNISSNFDLIQAPVTDPEDFIDILDISPKARPVAPVDTVPVPVPTIITTKIDLESPLTPLFKVDLGRRQRSRASIIEERVVSGAPLPPSEKSRKLNRLGRRFGTLPPLEMVFPPTPTSRSRFDPKRYTLELPPPLVRGRLGDDLNPPSMVMRGVNGHAVRRREREREREMVVELEMEEGMDDDEGRVMRVVWDSVTDEKSREKVMDALRHLR